MNGYHIRCFLLFGILVAPVRAAGQTLLERENQGKILGSARFTKDSVQLRWSPDHARLWLLGNKYGYIVDRVTIGVNGKQNSSWTRTSAKAPLRPLPLENWEALVNKIEKAAVVAQAIYGETFSVTHKTQGSPLGRAIQEREERDQRFGFSLLVADQFYEVAKASGLAFTDKNIKVDEKYIYRVYTPLPPSEKYRSDTAYIYADFRKQPVVGPPGGIEGYFGDRTIQLKWNNDNIPNYFSGYFIERAEKGKDFKILNKEPIVYFQNDAEADRQFGNKVIRNDSLPANNIVYNFRVRGLTPFGELSPPSAPVTGMGLEKINSIPVITIAGLQKDGRVQVNWEFPVENEHRIKQFQIRRSNAISKGGVSPDSVKATLLPTIRRYVDAKPLTAGYYQVVAIVDNAEELFSYPTLVELPDSVPPAVPINLQGNIDSTGVVRLSWKQNTEPDFAGYRVFRSNVEDGQYVGVIDRSHPRASYVDTINIQTITKYVYYKLVAVDRRDNPSEFSQILRLKRPDKYPPVAPFFKDYNVQHGVVKLIWTNSPSEDLDSTLLFRRKKDDYRWSKLTAFAKGETTQFSDSSGTKGSHYEYRIVAKDESGKFSVDDKKYLSVYWLELGLKNAPNLTVIKQKGSVRLDWNSLPRTKRILIYKKTNKLPLKLSEFVPGTSSFFEDKGVSADNSYAYRIKVVFQDNTESLFSEEQILNY